MTILHVLLLLVVAASTGYIAGHENGWREGRLRGRAEILRDRSLR